MTEDLITQVVTLLETGAAPITLAEVRGGCDIEPVRVDRRRGPLVAAAIALTAACAVAVIIATASDNGRPSVRSPMPATQVPYTKLPYASGDLAVFMHVDATDEQTAAVRRAIESAPGVIKFSLSTRDDAYRAFTRIFQNSPCLAHSITAQDLPESFNLKLGPPSDAADLEKMLGALPGVDSTETAAEMQGQGVTVPSNHCDLQPSP